MAGGMAAPGRPLYDALWYAVGVARVRVRTRARACREGKGHMSRVHELGKMSRVDLIAAAQRLREKSAHGGDRSDVQKIAALSNEQLISYILREEEEAQG